MDSIVSYLLLAFERTDQQISTGLAHLIRSDLPVATLSSALTCTNSQGVTDLIISQVSSAPYLTTSMFANDSELMRTWCLDMSCGHHKKRSRWDFMFGGVGRITNLYLPRILAAVERSTELIMSQASLHKTLERNVRKGCLTIRFRAEICWMQCLAKAVVLIIS